MKALARHVRNYGWGPWAYLGFLMFPIASPALNPLATVWHWLIVAASILCFLPLHFWAFDKVGRPSAIAAGGMAAIAVVGLSFGQMSGASAFLIYAAKNVGALGRPRLACAGILALMAVAAGFFLLSQIPMFPGRLWAFAPAFTFIPIIGAISVFETERAMSGARLSMAHQEVERLATIVERERIARDLHDILGHTLSLITLKSQLARKLTASEPDVATREMQELETISRDALSQMRHAVRGYRSNGLVAEIGDAERALGWADIDCDIRVDPVDLPPRHETALALALREGVTNIVRHSGATEACVRLRRRPGHVTFTLADNGRGGGTESNGLSGIRERIERLGGTFRRTADDGTTLTIRLPVGEGGAASPSDLAPTPSAALTTGS